MSLSKKLLVFLIIVFGLILRFHNYDKYPQRGATSDEYSYSFQGVSLLTKGVPISWSMFSVYKNKYDLKIDHIYFPIVQPYFDHTPLNGILVGGWSLMWGDNSFEKIDLKVIRIAPIIFSTISSILVFLIAYELLGYFQAMLALIIYSTTVIFAIQSRVVLSENLLTVWFLSAVYLFIKFKNKINFIIALTAGLLAGLAFWTKEIGIAVFFSISHLFIHNKIKLKYFVMFTAAVVLALGLYLLYGLHYGSDIFFKVLSTQSGRVIGPDTFLYVLSTPVLINKVYYDGWYFLGFLSLAIAFIDFKKTRYFLIPALIYFCLLMLALTVRGEMGWYIIPLFPFMAIATAWLINQSFTKYPRIFYLILLFIGQYQINYLVKENLGLSATVYRILTLALMLPFLILDMSGREKSFVKLSKIYLAIFFLINIFLVFNYVHPA